MPRRGENKVIKGARKSLNEGMQVGVDKAAFFSLIALAVYPTSWMESCN